MKLQIIIFFILITCLCVMAKSDGGSPGAFLNLDVSVRSYTLGKTGFTEYKDATALSGNPALLVNCRKDIYLMYTKLFDEIDDISHQALFFNNKINDVSGYGFGINGVTISDVEKRDVAGNKLGSYDGRDIVCYLSYGRNIKKNVSIGTNLKIINEKIDNYSRYNYTFDFSTNIDISKRFKIAAIIYNLIKYEGDYKFIAKKESIPIKLKTEFNIGLRKDVYFHLGLSYQEKENDMKYYTGVELDIIKILSVRAGFNSISEEWTLGFGLNIVKLKCDYGFGSHSDLGNTHRIGITYRFD